MNQGLLTYVAMLLATLAGSAAANCLTDTSQSNFQVGTLSGVDIASSPGDVLLTKQGSLDQQNALPVTNTTGTPFSTSAWVGQTFTARTSGPLTRADVLLGCSFCSGATPSILVSLRATSGGMPSGSDLASATIPGIDTSGARAYYAFNFNAPATISAGTQYALVIRPATAFPTGSSGTLALIRSGTQNAGSNTYAGGVLLNSSNSGATWAAQAFAFGDPTDDTGFATYVGAGFSSAGSWTSSLKDALPPAGTTPNWTSLAFTTALPANTAVKFQAAASTTATGPFNFVGPDGTAGSYFTSSGAALSQFNGSRYFKYRAYLSSSSGASTPAFNDATVCFSNVSANAADLSITNSDGVASATPGASVTYTIKAANAGPAAATGVKVTDTFPAGLTCSWTCSAAGNGSCSASGSGNINETTVGLPSGASATYMATCSIPASASGTLTNIASVTAPSGLSDPATGNNSATDSDTLVASTNAALSMTDNVDIVRVGDIVDYVIEITNNNAASNATISVTDTLPAQLTGGSWVCTASNGATCGNPSGSGSKLAESATVPSGGKVDYVYTATVVSGNANGEVANTATAKVTTSGNQATLNLSASDADMLVIFASNFDDGGAKVASTTAAGGGGSVTLQVGVDAGLAAGVGTTPVTIATGRAANGTALFNLQLMRLDGAIAMRTLTTFDGGAFSDASAWARVNLNGTFALTWHAASAHGDDGYLRAGSLPLSATNARQGLSQLQTRSERGVSWLVATPD